MYELQLQKHFPISPSELFAVWRDPEWIRRWFAPGALTVPEADVDFREGGKYRIVMQSPDHEQFIVSGTYLQIVEGEQLRFSWQWEGSPVVTEVTLLFTSDSNGCKLDLTHRQFPDVELRDKHEDGWNGCLAKLTDLVQTEGCRS
ncbi:MAG: SRPBCC domain-containing protein [Acidobacteria bacterium]|nr:SRPBCC domain-containing protein [Acidobacteriota bacterium]